MSAVPFNRRNLPRNAKQLYGCLGCTPESAVRTHHQSIIDEALWALRPSLLLRLPHSHAERKSLLFRVCAPPPEILNCVDFPRACCGKLPSRVI